MPTRDGAQQAERELLRACDSGLDVAALHQQVLRSLRRLTSVDAAFFATADPETLLFTGAYTEAPLGTATELFLENEFGGSDVNRFSSLATSTVPVASLDGVTRSDRWISPRYRDIMRPLGLGDELRAALVTDGQCWGYLCLHREASPLAFAPADLDLVTRLGPAIARGLRRAALLASPVTALDTAPGIVVLSEGLEVLATTPEAEHLLSLLPGAGRIRVPAAPCRPNGGRGAPGCWAGGPRSCTDAGRAAAHGGRDLAHRARVVAVRPCRGTADLHRPRAGPARRHGAAAARGARAHPACGGGGAAGAARGLDRDWVSCGSAPGCRR